MQTTNLAQINHTTNYQMGYNKQIDEGGDGAILFESFRDYFESKGERNWRTTRGKGILNNDFNAWCRLHDFDTRITESIRKRVIKRGFPDLWKIIEKKLIERGSIKTTFDTRIPKSEELTLKAELHRAHSRIEKLEKEIEFGLRQEIKIQMQQISGQLTRISDTNNQILAHQTKITQKLDD